jgi:hypothetical protein
MGRHIIEVLYGEDVVATGKRSYPSAEVAMTEVRSALDKLSLSNVIKPNGKLVELLP